MTLILSACQEDMFTCSDGFCIPFSQRCDRKVDCIDGADEEGCQVIESNIRIKVDEKSLGFISNLQRFPPTYYKNKPPGINEMDGFGHLTNQKPSLVWLNLDIFSVPAIETADMKFSVNFKLTVDPIKKFSFEFLYCYTREILRIYLCRLIAIKKF